MRKSAAAVISVAWGVTIGGTFGCLLPYLLGEWHFHHPLPYWAVARLRGEFLSAQASSPSFSPLPSSPGLTGRQCPWRHRRTWS